MILTEEKKYSISLVIEDENESGLGSEAVELEFTNKELLHAILTCGMSIQRLSQNYLDKHKMEILYKIFLVETALDAEGDRLKKSPRTMYLDSSEKSVISYYLGMFFTKLLSKKIYGIDYLTHLNTIEKIQGEGFIDYFNQKWRPDMIGYKVADDSWSVWEAKGGSNRRAPALKIGCEQAGDIKSINGRQPDPAVVCMTYYDHGYLNAIMKKTKSKDGAELEIPERGFWESYYGGIRQIFMEYGNTTRWTGGNVEVTIDIPCYHDKGKETIKRFITMGIPEELFQKIMKEDYMNMLPTKCSVQEDAGDGRYIGGDKIYIRS